MDKLIPEDLLEKFKVRNNDATILDFRVTESDVIKVETIYYKIENCLGIYSRTTIPETGYVGINNEVMTVADVAILSKFL